MAEVADRRARGSPKRSVLRCWGLAHHAARICSHCQTAEARRQTRPHSVDPFMIEPIRMRSLSGYRAHLADLARMPRSMSRAAAGSTCFFEHIRSEQRASHCRQSAALTPPVDYRTTSSARSRIPSGIVRRRAFAAFMLTTSTYCVGCSIGSSAGFAPRRILSTYSAARRNNLAWSTP